MDCFASRRRNKYNWQFHIPLCHIPLYRRIHKKVYHIKCHGKTFLHLGATRCDLWGSRDQFTMIDNFLFIFFLQASIEMKNSRAILELRHV